MILQYLLEGSTLWGEFAAFNGRIVILESELVRWNFFSRTRPPPLNNIGVVLHVVDGLERTREWKG